MSSVPGILVFVQRAMGKLKEPAIPHESHGAGRIHLVHVAEGDATKADALIEGAQLGRRLARRRENGVLGMKDQVLHEILAGIRLSCQFQMESVSFRLFCSFIALTLSAGLGPRGGGRASVRSGVLRRTGLERLKTLQEERKDKQTWIRHAGHAA